MRIKPRNHILKMRKLLETNQKKAYAERGNPRAKDQSEAEGGGGIGGFWFTGGATSTGGAVRLSGEPPPTGGTGPAGHRRKGAEGKAKEPFGCSKRARRGIAHSVTDC